LNLFGFIFDFDYIIICVMPYLRIDC